jgi:hypothetical protein
MSTISKGDQVKVIVGERTRGWVGRVDNVGSGTMFETPLRYVRVLFGNEVGVYRIEDVEKVDPPLPCEWYIPPAGDRA